MHALIYQMGANVKRKHRLPKGEIMVDKITELLYKAIYKKATKEVSS
jgi:hypothetical protein